MLKRKQPNSIGLVKCIRWAFLGGALWFVPLAHAAAPQSTTPADALGQPVADFELRDQDGKPWRLSQWAGRPVVLAFLGTECPLVKAYVPRLNELVDEFAGEKLVVLGIDSNQQDSLSDLATCARALRVGFPMLKDPGNRVADAVGAQRTPQVFLLDRQQVVRYIGRIDDQFGIGYQRPEPTRRDLARAIRDVLAGRTVEVPRTSALGCLIGRVKQPDATSDVTYARQISRLLERRCVHCHRPGEIGPMALTTYEEVSGWAEMIGEVVSEQRMPPWHADPAHGQFTNDARLTDDERHLVTAWVAAGAPEGDRAELPEPLDRVAGWQMGQPDLIVPIGARATRVPAKGTLDYRYVFVDPQIKEDKWVSAIELRAGNPGVVHHILAFVKGPRDRMPSGFGLMGYFGCMVPGALPETFPPGMAKKIPAGAKLVFQMHYTPNGTPQEDLSQMGLRFVDEREVQYEVKTAAAGNVLMSVPPYTADHTVLSGRPIRRDALLLSMFPHMHLRGKSFRYTARFPDGREEVLLDVPKYDFNWQHNYLLSEPKPLPAGTVLHCEAHFDNSADNPANPDPSALVGFGEQTDEEMMLGYFAAAVPRAGARKPGDDD